MILNTSTNTMRHYTCTLTPPNHLMTPPNCPLIFSNSLLAPPNSSLTKYEQKWREAEYAHYGRCTAYIFLLSSYFILLIFKGFNISLLLSWLVLASDWLNLANAAPSLVNDSSVMSCHMTHGDRLICLMATAIRLSDLVSHYDLCIA